MICIDCEFTQRRYKAGNHTIISRFNFRRNSFDMCTVLYCIIYYLNACLISFFTLLSSGCRATLHSTMKPMMKIMKTTIRTYSGRSWREIMSLTPHTGMTSLIQVALICNEYAACMAACWVNILYRCLGCVQKLPQHK